MCKNSSQLGASLRSLIGPNFNPKASFEPFTTWITQIKIGLSILRSIKVKKWRQKFLDCGARLHCVQHFSPLISVFVPLFFGFAAREGFLRFTFSDLTQKMTWGKDEASMVSAQGFSRQFSRKYSKEPKYINFTNLTEVSVHLSRP